MSTTADLIRVLKAELKSAGITYAALAAQLGLAESSVKRMFAQGDMPLSRIDAICRVLRTDFAELSRRLADEHTTTRMELTQEQERAVVADRRLLLAAICCLSQWTFEQMLASYRYEPAELVGLLLQLDRLGIIELREHNRYRLKVSKTFRWRPHGPVMQFFRAEVVPDYFRGGFDGEGEQLMLVHGEINRALAPVFNERLARIGADFARQHLADQRLPEDQKQPFTMVVGLRSWLFGPFRDLRRP
ncbi:helix-turn-helix domain-containing protein [Sphaerotilus natans]|uniref:helix-turn-helix domain-containing protein n=1 Tax=Sphaerotilus natans TaxID=34103 RepID=UPI00406CFE65